MGKYAQIVKNKVHWVFESAEPPNFAPYIEILDITNVEGVEEGWYYDRDTDSFSETGIDEPAPQPETTIEEYMIDLDFRLSNIELGL